MEKKKNKYPLATFHERGFGFQKLKHRQVLSPFHNLSKQLVFYLEADFSRVSSLNSQDKMEREKVGLNEFTSVKVIPQ